MRTRVVTVVAVSIAVLLIAGVGTALRLVHWHRVGFAGVSIYLRPPAEKESSSRFHNGAIVMILPESAASRSGLELGDVILAINGIPLTDRAALARLDKQVNRDDVVTYHVRRESKEIDVPVKFRSPIVDFPTIASLVVSTIVAVAFLVIGLLVFTRRPDDMRAIVFHVMSLVGATSVIVINAFEYDASNARGIARGSMYMLAWSVMVIIGLAAFPLTLHLALIFPKDRPIVRRRPYIVRWVYGVAIFATIVFMSLMLGIQVFAEKFERSSAYAFGRALSFGVGFVALIGMIIALRVAYIGRREGVRNAFLQRPMQTLLAMLAALNAAALLLRFTRFGIVGAIVIALVVMLTFFAFLSYPVLTCVALIRSYRDANAEEKRQVRWPLWGTVTAIGLKIVVYGASAVLGTLVAIKVSWAVTMFRGATYISFIPRVASLLIPISFAFAILKYRLMNIDVIIKKTVSYTILSGAIIFMYLVLVGGLGAVLINFAGVRSQTMVIASTLVVALVFVPLRNRLQTVVNRTLFRQKFDYPQALRTLAAETLAATDLLPFLGTAAETIQQALQNRAVVIFARRHDELVASAKVGVPDTVLGSARIDLMSAEGVDRPLDPRRRPLMQPAADVLRSLNTALVVPIRSHGALHGLIALAPKLSDQAFDLEDLEFASSAADQLAIATDRIRLQIEEEDFEQAREMQQALLPAEVPKIAGLDIAGTWKPARAVGGDYYDLLELSHSKVGICIGDVAGKGMPAALVMSALQAAVRATATEDVQPKDLCDRVRRVVVSNLSGGRFVTFFYCAIDTASKRLTYTNAGHNPPVLVRANGETHRLDVGGSVLSRLFRNEKFSQGEIEIRDGDRIVLFTDGVSESRDNAGTDFGEERLEHLIGAQRTLSASELLATIVDTVTSFSGGRTDDDLTLVVAAVTPPE